ncbi:MAG TPA: metallophosphoesterase [Verrucomicrobiae bacterium]|nr:metallophosphoesterase [Verrucomicrobiae bacterium]
MLGPVPEIVRPNDLVLPFFLVVQWRITVKAFAFVRRRFPARAATFARGGVVLSGMAIIFGFLLTFPNVVTALNLKGSGSLIAGALSLAYLLCATGALVVSFLVDRVRKHFAHRVDPQRRHLIATAGNVLMAAPLAALAGGYVRRNDFRVREIEVPLAGLPDGLNGLRILQLSDIHLSAFLSEADLARVIDASNELRANLAVITGDLISTRGDPLDACIRQLARVKIDVPMIGCLGNHERFAGAEDYCVAASARRGIRFLRHEAQAIQLGGATLNIAGVDYQSLEHKDEYLRGAERLIAPGATNLLLSHNPDVFPVAARQGYNLMLAGHTHGGQVTVEILDQAVNPARFITPYVYGLYRAGQSAAYVTRGIGTIGIPARIGAAPEITVVRLRKA